MRNGTFSSSNIHKLIKSGKGKNDVFSAPGLKYIKQVAYELLLGRELNVEREARPTSWGKFIEQYVYIEKSLCLQYDLVSKERLFHKTIKEWSGMPDLKKPNTVGDIKCPFSLEMFVDKIKALSDIEIYKEEFPNDYWQHISNAILLSENDENVTHFEAVIYVPYKSEIPLIKEYANNYSGDQNPISWIGYTEENGFPYVLDNGNFKDVNIFRFEIPEADKLFLTERVNLAVIEMYKLIEEPELQAV
jgi:hypothetical protein